MTDTEMESLTEIRLVDGCERKRCRGCDFHGKCEHCGTWFCKSHNYEGGEWEGQIPGTNKETILNFAGGYNCLHSFEYTDITQVSDKDRAAARRELRAIGIRI